MSIHLMLDTETLSTRANPVIRSIAVVPFNPLGDGPLGERATWFHRTLELPRQQEMGLNVDTNTVLWWLQQSDAARDAFIGVDRAQRPDTAFLDLSTYIKSWCNLSAAHHEHVPVWSYGAAADIVWIDSLARAFGYESPIHYRSARCLRTLVAVSCIRPEEFQVGRVLHDPTEDCLAQIEMCQHAYKTLGNLAV